MGVEEQKMKDGRQGGGGVEECTSRRSKNSATDYKVATSLQGSIAEESFTSTTISTPRDYCLDKLLYVVLTRVKKTRQTRVISAVHLLVV